MAKWSIQCAGATILALSLTIPVIGAQQTVLTTGSCAGSAAGPGDADKSSILRIRVLVCDEAGLSSETLSEAQRIASAVFREAAIEVLWLNGEQSSVTAADYILRIHCCFDKLKSGLDRRTVAFAPAGGRHITVFWDRIRTEAAAGSHPETLMIGYVLAHELGHLLLPAGYHSPYGVMQSRLSYEDWSRARRVGDLFFSEKEADQMRTALIGRLR